MTYQEIVQQIIDAGKNPNDFSITILDNGYKIEPRASYEPRVVAREEDESIKVSVAETNAILLEFMEATLV